MAAHTVIDFVAGGNSGDVVENGWGNVEPHGRWTTGHDATLLLPGLASPDGSIVELDVWPYVVPDKLPSQDLIVYVDEVRALSVRLTVATRLRFALPAGAARPGAPFRLRLRCPQATRPRSIVQSNDNRALGVSVKRVAVLPAGEAASGPLTPSADLPTAIASEAGAPARLPRVAAVTMVYNESVFLPIWLRHYARQVGIENCYVVDHGSDDGSTDRLGGASRVRIPRSPYDPHLQSRFNSEFCSSLLHWYDWVIYSDVDEIVVADPKIAASLTEYCARDLPEVVTAIGLNTIHCPATEPPLDLARPITEQRPYVFTASSMCKPLLIRRPVVWAPGSHAANAATVFDHLYMFHLRWFDLPQGLARLQKTRTMPWARTDVGSYQRVEDDKLVAQYSGRAGMPAIDRMDLDPSLDPLRGFLKQVMATRNEDPRTPFRISLDIWGKERWRIPPRFVGLF